jgi:hypothetical protein
MIEKREKKEGKKGKRKKEKRKREEKEETKKKEREKKERKTIFDFFSNNEWIGYCFVTKYFKLYKIFTNKEI